MAMAGEEGRGAGGGAGAGVLPNQHGPTAMPATSGTSSQRAAESPRDIKAIAHRLAAQPLPIARQDLWGLLTAVSDKARKRPQVCLAVPPILFFRARRVFGMCCYRVTHSCIKPLNVASDL